MHAWGRACAFRARMHAQVIMHVHSCHRCNVNVTAVARACVQHELLLHHGLRGNRKWQALRRHVSATGAATVLSCNPGMSSGRPSAAKCSKMTCCSSCRWAVVTAGSTPPAANAVQAYDNVCKHMKRGHDVRGRDIIRLPRSHCAILSVTVHKACHLSLAAPVCVCME